MKTKKVLDLLKCIALASLAALGIFALGSLVIAAVLTEIKNKSVREAVVFLLMMVMYAVFLYRFGMSNRLDTYAKHTDKFAIKKELCAYIHAEGKIMFVIYGIAAIVTEISCLVMQKAPQNPIMFVTSFFLGPWFELKIPVVRSILAFSYSAMVVCLLAILRSRKIYQEEVLAKNK